MEKIRSSFYKGTAFLMAALLIGWIPAPVMAQASETTAQEPVSETVSETEPETTAVVPAGPSGPGASTFTYDPSNGMYHNEYYTFDPKTSLTTPAYQQEYTFNPDTGMWDSFIWQYSEGVGYVKADISIVTPPEGSMTVGGPAAIANEPILDTTSEEPMDVTAQESNAVDEMPEVSTTTVPEEHLEDTEATGTDGEDSSLDSNTENTDEIINTVDIVSQSGNAFAADNDAVGNTETGDATVVTTAINMLQSQASLSGGDIATFEHDIQGDLEGDFIIDLTALTQPAAADPNSLQDMTINIDSNGNIVNDIYLDALSGDASAIDNESAGNVQTGDANAIANVINMINSVVAANQSFVGVINIHGDYAGNILMPEGTLDALLSSAGPASPGGNTSAELANGTNSSIQNNVDLSAVTGDVSAIDNDSVGDVLSGDALTNLTILNLTGENVVAENSLLVFVNVLGTWVGLIMDAPTGTTSAALSGGQGAYATPALASNLSTNGAQNAGITNNIYANARSGDALAADNDTVGGVASGNATASANIANIVGSQFALSNWFGVLFINVFGNWKGNFGVYKPPVVAPITSGVSGTASGPVGGMGGEGHFVRDMKVFSFVPKAEQSQKTTSAKKELTLAPIASLASGMGTATASTTTSTSTAKALQRANEVVSVSPGVAVATTPTDRASDSLASSSSSWSLMLLAAGFVGIGLVGADRIRTILRTRGSIY